MTAVVLASVAPEASCCLETALYFGLDESNDGESIVGEKLRALIGAYWGKFRALAEAEGFNPCLELINPFSEGNPWFDIASAFAHCIVDTGIDFEDFDFCDNTWAKRLNKIAEKFGFIYIGEAGDGTLAADYSGLEIEIPGYRCG